MIMLCVSASRTVSFCSQACSTIFSWAISVNTPWKDFWVDNQKGNSNSRLSKKSLELPLNAKQPQLLCLIALGRFIFFVLSNHEDALVVAFTLRCSVNFYQTETKPNHCRKINGNWSKQHVAVSLVKYKHDDVIELCVRIKRFTSIAVNFAFVIGTS